MAQLTGVSWCAVVSLWKRFWCSDRLFKVFSVHQAVWPACPGCVGEGLQAERADGHEAVDLWTQELEQLHLLETGGVWRTAPLCVTFLYPNAADRHVDGTSENEEELLAEGTFLFYSSHCLCTMKVNALQFQASPLQTAPSSRCAADHPFFRNLDTTFHTVTSQNLMTVLPCHHRAILVWRLSELEANKSGTSLCQAAVLLRIPTETRREKTGKGWVHRSLLQCLNNIHRPWGLVPSARKYININRQETTED